MEGSIHHHRPNSESELVDTQTQHRYVLKLVVPATVRFAARKKMSFGVRVHSRCISKTLLIPTQRPKSQHRIAYRFSASTMITLDCSRPTLPEYPQPSHISHHTTLTVSS
jgi:hypothetical protein